MFTTVTLNTLPREVFLLKKQVKLPLYGLTNICTAIIPHIARPVTVA